MARTIDGPAGQVVTFSPLVNGPSVDKAIDDAFRHLLSAAPAACSRALGAREASFLAKRLAKKVEGTRRGPSLGVSGHIRVLLVLSGHRATVSSLVVRCGAGNGATDRLAQLYPAIRRANDVLATVQEALTHGSASLPRDVHQLLHALGQWAHRPEVRGESLAELRALLAHADRASPAELQEVHEAALDLRGQVGDPETEADARSIELAFVLAALSSVLDAAPTDTMVIATGCIELDAAALGEASVHVRRVTDFDKKRREVLRWAKAQKRRVVFLYPRENTEHATGVEATEWARWVRAEPVSTLQEAWNAIPRCRPRIWTWAEVAFAAATALWYFERVLVGEYAGDPATVAKLGWTRGVVLSTVAGLIMGGIFFAEVVHGPRVPSLRARRALSFAYFPAACIVMLLFIFTGSVDFPTYTEFMKNHDAASRQMWVWKDIALMYPVVLVFFSAFWRVTRADTIAGALRRAGLPWAARDALEEANDLIGQMVRKSYPYLAMVYAVVNASLLGYDFFWYGQQSEKTFSQRCMIGHILFQVAWGFLCFGYAPLHLRAPQRRLAATPGDTPTA